MKDEKQVQSYITQKYTRSKEKVKIVYFKQNIAAVKDNMCSHC